MAAASYLGNHSSPSLAGDRAESGGLRSRRDDRQHSTSAASCILQNPTQGQFYGTIGQLDDTGRGNYSAVLLSLQRRLKNNFSVLVATGRSRSA